MRRSILAVMLAMLAVPPVAAAERIDEIIGRLENANRWRDHVMVVAHRAGWKEDGQIRWPENSLAGLRHVIGLGVEMVEIDVRTSADGQFVVMHDSWLDRTTTCTGEVAKRTLAELRQCRLIVEGEGAATDEVVPTLQEMLAAAKGHVLVNIDNKLGPDQIGGLATVVRAMDMQREVLVKENVWSQKRLDEIEAAVTPSRENIRFMPIFADDAVTDSRFAETVTKAFSADLAEMVAWRGEANGLSGDAGPLFRARMRAAAIRGDWHLWVNTYPIVNKPAGFLARGRGDELAVFAHVPGEVYGFWAEQGATIIQTDEPKAAIEWLEGNGYRIPYGLTN